MKVESDHFDGRRFFNPGDRTVHGFADLVRWQLTSRRTPWPAWVEHPLAPPPPPVQPGHLHATFVNHSTFLLRTPGLAVLTDPVFSLRASPVRWIGPARVHAPGLPLDALPAIDVVVVSHGHYDHMDLPTLRWLDRRFEPLFVAPLGNRRYLSRAGLRRVVELDWWASHTVGGGRVTLAPAQHFAARSPFDRNRALWGSMVIQAGRHRVYFAGDSGYAAHFHAIAERFGSLELALLPIGAYEPRWFMKPMHMNPAEAVQAHLDLGARQSVAMHFGCFQLTDEGIDEPVRALGDALASRGVPPEQFRALTPGETLTVTS